MTNEKTKVIHIGFGGQPGSKIASSIPAVNEKEVESKVEREFNERYEEAEKIRCRASIVMHGKKGIAQCEHTGIEIPCLELDGELFSKFGDPLPSNWIWRPAMSRKAAALLIGMLIGSILVIALIRSGGW